MLNGFKLLPGFSLPAWEVAAMSLIVGGLAFYACVRP
jgi:hypothetical protein